MLNGEERERWEAGKLDGWLADPASLTQRYLMRKPSRRMVLDDVDEAEDRVRLWPGTEGICKEWSDHE